jgi:site-specific recombinase XerD
LQREKLRFETFAQDYLRDYAVNGKKTLRDAQSNVDRLTEFFGGDRVIEITSRRINEYIGTRRVGHLSNGSINRELSALKRMFHLAARQEPPTVQHVPVIPMLKERNTRTGFFEHEEFLSLRGCLPDH